MRVSHIALAATALLVVCCGSAATTTDSKVFISHHSHLTNAIQNVSPAQRSLRTAKTSDDDEERMNLLGLAKVKDNFAFKRLDKMLANEKYMFKKFGEWKKAGFDAKSIKSKIDLDKRPHLGTLVTQFGNYLKPGV
ncbi:hypothetical protein PHYBOEH_003538 [Phytophthora boehmeriae]|uniref:RxLR effector protein n=1 Tax=Phytophthora boehmeriae TaxID=109152 RepID=A0A8T1XF43_9STRA|nr:hypothetical protein PHYBOEH_003538 [Phytophthora boehmeriae]